VQALHQRHIFHRNLTPSNILIDAEAKSAKIIDFQIAVSLRGRDQVTQVAGTLPYMAKEVLEGHADQRADIYSVGVMLYELLTGKLPFWATSQRALVEQISSVPAPEPKSLNAALPEYLNDAILRALSKDPARRFQTAAELRDALVAGEARPEPESWLSTITPESTAP
jgi:serine/threonine-protein kinase